MKKTYEVEQLDAAELQRLEQALRENVGGRPPIYPFARLMPGQCFTVRNAIPNVHYSQHDAPVIRALASWRNRCRKSCTNHYPVEAEWVSNTDVRVFVALKAQQLTY